MNVRDVINIIPYGMNMKKTIVKCPNCNSTKVLKSEFGLKCLNCSFVNDKRKKLNI